MANGTNYAVIGIDAAVDSVRHFLGDPDANVTVECDVTTLGGMGYTMGSGGNYFTVNGRTGEVEYAIFLNNPVGNFFSGNVISGEQGKAIAQAYAACHYLGFDANASWHYLGSVLRQDGKGGYFYEYEWREFAGNATTLNDVIVAVGVGGGEIHSYQGIRVPAGFEDDFTVSQRDAARIAASALGNITGENTLSNDTDMWTFNILFKYAFPDKNGSLYGDYLVNDLAIRSDLARTKDNLQRVIWRVDLDASPVPENGNAPLPWHYTILVDACNGEVTDIIHYR